ncbi:MAG: IPT/TIG domain-containing protein, partial [Prevotella sp.]|nr:IPT/TIG domain-containing protein [Prevotella sp.]
SVVGVTAFTVAEDGKSIKVKVPETSTSGSVVLNAASGLTTSVDITVPLASVTSTDPTKDVKAGQTITIKGTNLDRIQHLLLTAIDGEFTNFTKSATQITFVVPEKMGDGTVVLVQHANWSVESAKISMYSEAPETTLWAGSQYIGEWNGSMSALAYGAYDWSTAKPGQVLTAYLTPDMSQGWSQIRFGNGSWTALPGTADVNPLSAEDTKFSVTLTQAMIDELVANGGLVICGAYFTVTKVTLSILEDVIWSGNVALGNWAAGMDALSWGKYDWSQVAVGKTLKLYYEVDSSVGYINIRFGNGSWAALPSTQGWGNDGNASPDPSETSIKTTLTEADLNELKNNGGLVICGAGIICKKVVLQ